MSHWSIHTAIAIIHRIRKKPMNANSMYLITSSLFNDMKWLEKAYPGISVYFDDKNNEMIGSHKETIKTLLFEVLNSIEQKRDWEEQKSELLNNLIQIGNYLGFCGAVNTGFLEKVEIWGYRFEGNREFEGKEKSSWPTILGVNQVYFSILSVVLSCIGVRAYGLSGQIRDIEIYRLLTEDIHIMKFASWEKALKNPSQSGLEEYFKIVRHRSQEDDNLLEAASTDIRNRRSINIKMIQDHNNNRDALYKHVS